MKSQFEDSYDSWELTENRLATRLAEPSKGSKGAYAVSVFRTLTRNPAADTTMISPFGTAAQSTNPTQSGNGTSRPYLAPGLNEEHMGQYAEIKTTSYPDLCEKSVLTDFLVDPQTSQVFVQTNDLRNLVTFPCPNLRDFPCSLTFHCPYLPFIHMYSSIVLLLTHTIPSYHISDSRLALHHYMRRITAAGFWLMH